eukprot:6995025-Pyramimonas_sp.AAC.1
MHCIIEETTNWSGWVDFRSVVAQRGRTHVGDLRGSRGSAANVLAIVRMYIRSSAQSHCTLMFHHVGRPPDSADSSATKFEAGRGAQLCDTVIAIVPRAGESRGNDEPCQAKMLSVSMANRTPRDEAQSYISGRPLEHKRPRTNARYPSPLPNLFKSQRPPVSILVQAMLAQVLTAASRRLEIRCSRE